MGRIVVGIDGSDDAKAALRWAVTEAGREGHDVKAIYVYGFTEEQNPFFSAYTSFASGSTATRGGAEAQRWQQEREEAAHRQATEVLAAAVRDAVESPGEVKIDQMVVPGGRPARALLERARGAVALAIGARGRGGFRGLRLGSTADKCVRHAPCSVMVARSTS